MAPKPFVHRRIADDDIDGIAAWLKREASPEIALRFLDAVRSARNRLREHPGIGSLRHAHLFPGLAYPLRFHPVHGFDTVLIYYMDRPDAVEIVRVWDARQNLESLIDTTPA